MSLVSAQLNRFTAKHAEVLASHPDQCAFVGFEDQCTWVCELKLDEHSKGSLSYQLRISHSDDNTLHGVYRLMIRTKAGVTVKQHFPVGTMEEMQADMASQLLDYGFDGKRASSREVIDFAMFVESVYRAAKGDVQFEMTFNGMTGGAL